MFIPRSVAIPLAIGVVGVGSFVATPSHASAQSFPPCTYTSSEPTTYYGQTGAAVKQVQCEFNQGLANNGRPSGVAKLAIDGSFGSATQAAIKRFQTCYPGNLSVDGVVGPQTWAALNRVQLQSIAGWKC